ncbi:MAG: response regulator transcription factor [Burkholderiales bacterium]|nr:response regulator transcription factor [Burkholderiales bacterium]
MTAPPTTIVIADDHMLVREGLKMLLSAEPDLRVVADTGNGAAVEALVRELAPTLLVLDLELPGKSGIEIAAAIKADASLACKVLVLTGNLRAETVARALAAGADGYVVKSEDAAELLTAVRTVLAGQGYVSRQIAGAFAAGAGAAPGAAAAPITPREREVLSLVARGYGNNDIAGLMGISVLTVRTHRQRLMEKLGLRNAAEITAYAVKLGLYDPT